MIHDDDDSHPLKAPAHHCWVHGHEGHMQKTQGHIQFWSPCTEYKLVSNQKFKMQ